MPTSIHRGSARIVKALVYGGHAHDSIKQVRKYSGLPYWTHTEAVAKIVLGYVNDEDEIIAALLHDVVEDVPGYSVAGIGEVFGNAVASMVEELTDVYTHAAYPKVNRAARKELENKRLSTVSDNAKLIKLADIIDNTISIARSDPKFARVYVREIRELLEGIKPSVYRLGNSELYLRAKEITDCLD